MGDTSARSQGRTFRFTPQDWIIYLLSVANYEIAQGWGYRPVEI
ncbi:hypothetical protein [Nostoc sp.]